jgi:hypothetical protein
MNELLQSVLQFLRNLQLWIIVSPWEQALRVRAGKHVKLLGAGIHWKIPFLDSFYLQSVRLRISTLGRQTISSRDRQTFTLAAAMGYAIDDIQQLYNTLHHAEDTLVSLARTAIADYITLHDGADCQPPTIEKAATGTLDFKYYGLKDVRVYITEFASVRTFRLIGDASETRWQPALITDQAYGKASSGS